MVAILFVNMKTGIKYKKSIFVYLFTLYIMNTTIMLIVL